MREIQVREREWNSYKGDQETERIREVEREKKVEVKGISMNSIVW